MINYVRCKCGCRKHFIITTDYGLTKLRCVHCKKGPYIELLGYNAPWKSDLEKSSMSNRASSGFSLDDIQVARKTIQSYVEEIRKPFTTCMPGGIGI